MAGDWPYPYEAVAMERWGGGSRDGRRLAGRLYESFAARW